MSGPNDKLATDLNGLANAYILQNLLAQIQDNLNLIQQGAAGTVITVSGGSLYQLASQYYNDATQWTTIAQANGLDDPFLPVGQVIKLVIPSQTKSNTGGVLTS